MASLVLPPVTRRRSLVTGTGSNYQDRRSLTDRPRQTSPEVPPRTGSSGQKGRSSRNRHSSDHQELDEDKLRAHRFWVAWGRQVAEDMLRTSMEVCEKHADRHAMLSCILFVFTVCPRYNAPRYNADSVITRSVLVPKLRLPWGKIVATLMNILMFS